LPANFDGEIQRGTFKELSQSYSVLKYDEVVEPVSFHLNEEMIMDYCIGYDLLSNTEVLVPAPLTIFRYTPSPPSINPYAYFHTNGLASGNVIEEAICHALCEVIERDAMSIAELRASAIPFHILRTVVHSFNSSGVRIPPIPADKFIDDPNIFPDIDVSDIDFEQARNLIDKFNRAGISLTIKNITSDIG